LRVSNEAEKHRLFADGGGPQLQKKRGRLTPLRVSSEAEKLPCGQAA